MCFDRHGERLLQLLCYVGYCVEFPSKLAKRIGGHPEWSRHTMYRAINEEYVTVWRHDNGNGRHLVRSLRLTEKGLAYVGDRSPEMLSLIQYKQEMVPQYVHYAPERVRRYHAYAIGTVMAHNAGAVFLPWEKPALLSAECENHPFRIDDTKPYYYGNEEVRAAVQELFPDEMIKGSRLVGIIVQGPDCYCLYHTGGVRMYWMRTTEENYVSMILVLLAARKFRVNVIRQVVIGNSMKIAGRVCKTPSKDKGTRYYVLSNYFNNCYFLPNTELGDRQLKIMLDETATMRVNEEFMKECVAPDYSTKFYDALCREDGRPAILNGDFDMLRLSGADTVGEDLGKAPVFFCFDHQLEIMQMLVGPQVEVRSLGRIEEYG